MSFGSIQAEKMTTESGYSLGAGNASSFKNRLINGAMTISQRGTTFAVGPQKYTLDRYLADISTSVGQTFSVTQSTDAPTGFTNSLLVTTTNAGTTATGDYSYLRQVVEGFNWADSMYGTASAKTFTLSFWVKSSLTGTFGMYVASQSNLRFQTLSYTIPVANTWTYITISFVGDTLVSSTNWNTGNGVGLQFAWTLTCGASYQVAPGSWGSSLGLGVPGNVNVLSTSGSTFAITGCQLEVGTVATSFDFRDIGRELLLCYRYYQQVCVNSGDIGTGSAPMRLIFANNGGTQPLGGYPFPCTMRTSPTLTNYGAGVSGGSWNMNSNVGSATAQTTFASTDIGPKGIRMNATSGTSGGNGQYWVDMGTGSTQLGMAFSAEL